MNEKSEEQEKGLKIYNLAIMWPLKFINSKIPVFGIN